MQLANWQRQFMDFVQARDDKTNYSGSYFLPGHNTAQKGRLAAYQNNYHSGLVNVLKLKFSQVEALVGDLYFQQLAGDYISQNPLTEKNTLRYGETFPTHVQHVIGIREELYELPYLADVAKADWALHESYYAEPRSKFDVSSYGALSLGEQKIARPRLAKDVFVLRAYWPLTTLWRFFLGECDLNTVAQADVEQDYIVHRPQHRPLMETLTKDELNMICGIQHNMTIVQLAEIDAHGIPQFIANGWITGFEV